MTKLQLTLPKSIDRDPDHVSIRIPYIDGLRAIAILSVLAYHFELGVFTNGFLGVDIFFVISGYVVCKSLTDAAENGHNFLSYLENFYRRRFWRLIPALAAMVIMTLMIASLFIPPAYLSRHIFFTAAAAMTGTANIVLALASGTNYFDQMTGYNPLLHSWSLGVEEQFYVIFPFIIWFIVKHPKWSPILPLLVVTSFLMAIFWFSSQPTYSFYLLPFRFWELSMGALAFCYAHKARHRLPGYIGHFAGWTGLCLVILSLAFPVTVTTPIPGAIVPTLGIVLLLWYAQPKDTAPSYSSVAFWLSWDKLVYIGKISYSLYLWHWPVIVLMRWTIGYTETTHMIFAAVLSFSLAMLSFHFIEQPFQATKRAQTPLLHSHFISVSAFIVLLPLMVILVGQGRDFNLFKPLGQLSVVQQEFGWAATDLPTLGPQIPTASSSSKPSIIVIGDSHAAHLSGAAAVVAAELGIGLEIVGGCGYSLRAPVTNPSCKTTLERAQKGDVVVFSALNIPRYVNQDGLKLPEPNFSSPTNIQSQKDALNQFIQIAQSLSERGVALVYRGPEPLFHYIPFRCSDWFNRMNAICNVEPRERRDDLLARAEQSIKSIAIVQREIPTIVLWNVFDILCPDETCEIYNKLGKPLFFDQDHLSGWGAELLVESFLETVSGALHKPRM